MYFPLGILYLTAVVKASGFSVKIVDMRGGKKRLPKAEFYGFSCTTPEMPCAKELIKGIKGQTIIGGAHPTLKPSDCSEFDYVVAGEGEMPIQNILKGNAKSKLFIADRLKNLDDIPYPDWDAAEDCFSEELFPGERYGQGQKAMTLITSRGCPYKCSFCGNIFNNPVIWRSAQNIIGELEQLIKRGVTHFRFEDDNFTVHPDFDNLCLDLQRLGIHWKCHTRSNLLRQEQAELMRWAGCEECGMGVESADDRVLGINNKKETVKHHIQAIHYLHKAGIRVKTYFIAGLPGETSETIKINKSFFMACKPDKWTLSTFTPYPGCDVYNNPEKYKVKILDWDYSHWWNFVEQGFVHELEGQTQEEMWERYKEFYGWLLREEWKGKN